MIMVPLERPIAFYPQLARMFGVNGALLLQQIMYWTPRGRLDDGWIYKTRAEIEEETTLTRTQQDTCIKILVDQGVLETKIARVQGTTVKHFRVLERALEKAIIDSIAPRFSDPPECRKPTTRNAGNLQSGMQETCNPYIRTETTTETTKETANAVSCPVSPKSAEPEPRDLACAEWMFSLILALNPNHKKPKFDSWAKTIRLMRERDGRTHEDIARLFGWANDDPFWRTNILSPEKLRKQWDKLEIQMRHSHERNQPVRGSSKSDGHRVASRIIDEDIERCARAMGGGVHGADAVDVRGEVDGQVFDGF